MGGDKDGDKDDDKPEALPLREESRSIKHSRDDERDKRDRGSRDED